MDPLHFLRTTDSFERQVIWAVVRHAREIREIEYRNLAVFIQEGTAKILGAK